MHGAPQSALDNLRPLVGKVVDDADREVFPGGDRAVGDRRPRIDMRRSSSVKIFAYRWAILFRLSQWWCSSLKLDPLQLQPMLQVPLEQSAYQYQIGQILSRCKTVRGLFVLGDYRFFDCHGMQVLELGNKEFWF